MNTTKCVAIVTGPARSGTTMINRIINSHPDVMSGFELGILLSRIPDKVEKLWATHSAWMAHGGDQFGLPNSYLSDVEGMPIDEVYRYVTDHKGSQPIDEVYRRLTAEAEYFTDKTPEYFYHPLQRLTAEAEYFTDKTPEYFYHLPEVVNLSSDFGIPVIAIVKDFDSYVHSLLRRECDLLRTGLRTGYAMQNIPDSVFMFKYESFKRDPEAFVKAIEEIVYRHNPHLKRESLSLERFEQKIGAEDYPYNNWKPTEMTDEVRERIASFEHLRAEYTELYEGIRCATS